MPRKPTYERVRELFSAAKEAAEVYDSEVIKYQGQFALTNKQLGLLS